MSNGLNNVYLIVALVATSFAAGRFYADGSLVEENRKLTESLRFLRGEKLGYAHEKPGGGPWRDERRPTAVAVAPAAASGREPEAQPASPGAAPVAVAASAAAAAAMPTATPAAAVEKPRAETVAQDAPPRNAAVSQPGPVPAHAPDGPNRPPRRPSPRAGRRARRGWPTWATTSRRRQRTGTATMPRWRPAAWNITPTARSPSAASSNRATPIRCATAGPSSSAGAGARRAARPSSTGSATAYGGSPRSTWATARGAGVGV